jgi:multidrug efflux pump subunit AcrA (membrane-fusion protein)
MSLVAHLSVGDPMRGVIVPTSAVVWSQGKAWVYLQTAPDRFTRRPVATDIAVEAGFFVGSVLRAGDKVVTEGAQALLSEEVLKRGAGAADVD